MLATKLPEINALKAAVLRTPQLKDDVDDFPAPKLGRGPMGGTAVGMPSKKDTCALGDQDGCPAADQGARTGERRKAAGLPGAPGQPLVPGGAL